MGLFFSPFLTLGNIIMDSFPSTFSLLDQSPQPRKTTSTQPYNSIFASGQTRSKLCLSSRHGSKPNHPPLLCDPKSSPTSPLTLPLPSPTSLLSIMQKNINQDKKKISSHDPLPSYPFVSHHFPFIYTSPIPPHASPFISHMKNRGGTPLQLLLLPHGCPDQPQREKDAPLYYIVVTGCRRCISSLHNTLPLGENTLSSLLSCFHMMYG